MKVRQLLFGAATLATLGMVSTSCTNEMVSPYPEAGGSKKSMLVQAPDIYAWSGKDQLGNTRSGLTRGADAIIVEDIRTDKIDMAEEEQIINDYLPEKNENLKEGIQKNFLFIAEDDITFDMYPVYCQTNNPKTVGIFYYDNTGAYHEVENIFEGITKWQGITKSEWVWHEDIGQTIEEVYTLGKRITIPKGYIFGFFWNGTINYQATTLYSVEDWNEETICTDGEGVALEPERKSKLHGVTFELDGKTYMGMEDWTDFDFQDLVFSCPADLKEVPVTEIPSKGEPWPGTDPKPTPDPEDPDDDCDICHHPSHDGVCEKCTPGSECHPEDQPGVQPEDPVVPGNPGNVKHHSDEVEVNFSINDVHTDKNGQKYENADLWTKLSIHVRKGTDVKIHVPLPGRYLCDSDDFAILQDHANGIYSGQGFDKAVAGEIYTHSMTYTIESEEQTWNVTLTVTIDEEGMDIVTDGITEELVEYLFEKNGDGINFEIWNYYQTETVDWIDGQKHVVPTLSEADYAAFQGFLDKSTIEFLDEAPSFYINAFGFDWTDGTYSQNIRPRDCTVTPVDTAFEMNPNFCYHLNGTPWNIIWIHNTVDNTSYDYKSHTMSPNPAVTVD